MNFYWNQLHWFKILWFHRGFEVAYFALAKSIVRHLEHCRVIRCRFGARKNPAKAFEMARSTGRRRARWHLRGHKTYRVSCRLEPSEQQRRAGCKESCLRTASTDHRGFHATNCPNIISSCSNQIHSTTTIIANAEPGSLILSNGHLPPPDKLGSQVVADISPSCGGTQAGTDQYDKATTRGTRVELKKVIAGGKWGEIVHTELIKAVAFTTKLRCAWSINCSLQPITGSCILHRPRKQWLHQLRTLMNGLVETAAWRNDPFLLSSVLFPLVLL